MNVDDHISTATLLATEGDYDSAIQLLSNLPDEMQQNDKLQKALKKLFTDKMDAMQDAMQAQAVRQRQVAAQPIAPPQGAPLPPQQQPFPKAAIPVAHAVARVARPPGPPGGAPVKMPPMPIPGMQPGANPGMNPAAALQAARMAAAQQQHQQLLAAQQARLQAAQAVGNIPQAKPAAPQAVAQNLPPAAPQQLLEKRTVAPPFAIMPTAEVSTSDLLQVASSSPVVAVRVPEAPPVVRRKGHAKKAPLPPTLGFSPTIEAYWRAVLEKKESDFKTKYNAIQSEIREANKMIAELRGELPSTRGGGKRKGAEDGQIDPTASKKPNGSKDDIEESSASSE